MRDDEIEALLADLDKCIAFTEGQLLPRAAAAIRHLRQERDEYARVDHIRTTEHNILVSENRSLATQVALLDPLRAANTRLREALSACVEEAEAAIREVRPAVLLRITEQRRALATSDGPAENTI